MKKSNKKSDDFVLWDGIGEDDFLSETVVSDEDIGEFNTNNMIIYSANINYARQFVRGDDSLTPVQRRLLYAMYLCKAMPGHEVKSTQLMGTTMIMHNHSPQAAYKSLIGMGQYWKNAVPLIYGDCNLGLITAPDDFAADRYTELAMTNYAKECFFDDFDEKLVATKEVAIGVQQPDVLPSKFPNILVNGNAGIGWGFASSIPPFNIDDVIDVCTKVINDPDIDVKQLVIYPDLPTEADIVENLSEIEQFCTTGKGKLVQRAKIDIEDKGSTWRIVIRSIPYGVNFDSVREKIIELKRKDVIPFTMHDDSKPYIVKTMESKLTKRELEFDLEIPKSHDPKMVRHLLFKNCGLEQTTPLQMRVIKEEGKPTILLTNIKELINLWLDARRLYKRSYYNSKFNKIMSTISIDKALIYMLKGANLEKTVKIIKESSDSEVVSNLISAYRECKLNSYQARLIADKNLRAFTKDAAAKYEREVKELEETLEDLKDIMNSPRRIDEIILKELQDLRKYATPRKSRIITVRGESTISDTDHRLVITTQGRIKKLPAEVDSLHKKLPYGAFEQGDMIKSAFKVNNLGALFMFDSLGKYSLIQVSDIPNTLYSDHGSTIYDVTKLSGDIMSTSYIQNKDLTSKKKDRIKVNKNSHVYFVSARGFIKKTPYSEFVRDTLGKSGSIKNSIAAKVRDDDRIVHAFIAPYDLIKDCDIIIYTAKGDYVALPASSIPEMGRNATGLSMLTPADDDEVVGTSFVFTEDEYAVIVTERGCMKKIELKYLKQSKQRKDSSYISSLDGNDRIALIACGPDTAVMNVITKSGIKEFNFSEILTLARKHVPVKIVPFLTNEKVHDVLVIEK